LCEAGLGHNDFSNLANFPDQVRLALPQQNHLFHFAKAAVLQKIKINAGRRRGVMLIQTVPLHLVPARNNWLIQKRLHQSTLRIINFQRHFLRCWNGESNFRGGIERVGIILFQLEIPRRRGFFFHLCGGEQIVDHGVDRGDIDAKGFITNDALLIDDNGPFVANAIRIADTARHQPQGIGNAGALFEGVELRRAAIVIIQADGLKGFGFARLINLGFCGWTSRNTTASIPA